MMMYIIDVPRQRGCGVIPELQVGKSYLGLEYDYSSSPFQTRIVENHYETKFLCLSHLISELEKIPLVDNILLFFIPSIEKEGSRRSISSMITSSIGQCVWRMWFKMRVWLLTGSLSWCLIAELKLVSSYLLLLEPRAEVKKLNHLILYQRTKSGLKSTFLGFFRLLGKRLKEGGFQEYCFDSKILESGSLFILISCFSPISNQCVQIFLDCIQKISNSLQLMMITSQFKGKYNLRKGKIWINLKWFFS